MNDAIYFRTGVMPVFLVLSIRISRIDGNVDIRQRNLYNTYVFERSGRDGASLPFLALVAFSFLSVCKKQIHVQI